MQDSGVTGINEVERQHGLFKADPANIGRVPTPGPGVPGERRHRVSSLTGGVLTLSLPSSASMGPTTESYDVIRPEGLIHSFTQVPRGHWHWAALEVPMTFVSRVEMRDQSQLVFFQLEQGPDEGSQGFMVLQGRSTDVYSFEYDDADSAMEAIVSAGLRDTGRSGFKLRAPARGAELRNHSVLISADPFLVNVTVGSAISAEGRPPWAGTGGRHAEFYAFDDDAQAHGLLSYGDETETQIFHLDEKQVAEFESDVLDNFSASWIAG